ncbi:murein hydrolase activator EnvC family protein [Phaeacidiphilus oryzae]|uniref:murein hydrolase activator EnvC family protein n=1 Tax=Phaeacidiphilus oryzae TaxID=348818 RepID=UPI00068EC44B|nr:M23 family metallopeptidase [Phaeacidiphilus oryzae]
MASYRVTWGADSATAGTEVLPEGPTGFDEPGDGSGDWSSTRPMLMVQDPAMAGPAGAALPTQALPVVDHDPALDARNALDGIGIGTGPGFAPDSAPGAQVPAQGRRWASRPGSAAMLGLAAMAAVGGATASSAYAAEPSAAAGGGRAGVAAEDTASNPLAQQEDRQDPGLALAARLSGHAEAANRGAQEARLRAAEEARARAAASAAAADSASGTAVAAAAAAEAGTEASEVGELVAPVEKSEGRAVATRAGYWSHLNPGKDIAAKSGTVVRAIGDGEITSAAWAGSHGYRVVQTLRDGTQIWYCHLAAVAGTGSVSAGQPVGRVGATGGLASSRLHLEVRTGGGEPQDASAWLARHGLSI